MPYKRKTRNAKKSYAKKKISYRDLPASLRPEMKQITRSLEGSQMSALTENQLVIMPFSHITQGTGVNQRVGNEVTLKSLHVRGHLENRSSSPQTMFVRMAIIRDNKEMATAFNGDNALIKSNTAVSLGTLGAESSYLAWNKDRYSVIYNKVLKLGSASTNGRDIVIFNKFQKLNGKAKFTYTIGAPGAINTNNWQFVMWACDPDNAGQNTSLVNGYFQVNAYYTDQ